MATAQSSTSVPVFEYTLSQRAALQVLSDALRHVAEDHGQPDSDDIDAAWLLWGFREVIAMDGLRLPGKTGRLHPGTLSIVWRNPRKKAGAL